jgi:hypothetical protein
MPVNSKPAEPAVTAGRAAAAVLAALRPVESNREIDFYLKKNAG